MSIEPSLAALSSICSSESMVRVMCGLAQEMLFATWKLKTNHEDAKLARFEIFTSCESALAFDKQKLCHNGSIEAH